MNINSVQPPVGGGPDPCSKVHCHIFAVTFDFHYRGYQMELSAGMSTKTQEGVGLLPLPIPSSQRFIYKNVFGEEMFTLIVDV